MSDGYKTIRVPESAFKVAKASKGEDETWGDFLNRAVDSQPNNTVDAENLAHKIANKIEETQGVKIENVELSDGSTMTRDDVETIIESWVESNYDRLRRGQIGE